MSTDLLIRIFISLPKIKQDARAVLAKTLNDLAALPPPPSTQPFSELLKLLTSFCDKVSGLIDGSSGNEDLMRYCRQAHRKFKSSVAMTHPHFLPFERPESLYRSWEIELSDEDDHIGGLAAGDDHPSCIRMNLTQMREYLERWVGFIVTEHGT